MSFVLGLATGAAEGTIKGQNLANIRQEDDRRATRDFLLNNTLPKIQAHNATRDRQVAIYNQLKRFKEFNDDELKFAINSEDVNQPDAADRVMRRLRNNEVQAVPEESSIATDANINTPEENQTPVADQEQAVPREGFTAFENVGNFFNKHLVGQYTFDEVADSTAKQLGEQFGVDAQDMAGWLDQARFKTALEVTGNFVLKPGLTEQESATADYYLDFAAVTGNVDLMVAVEESREMGDISITTDFMKQLATEQGESGIVWDDDNIQTYVMDSVIAAKGNRSPEALQTAVALLKMNSSGLTDTNTDQIILESGIESDGTRNPIAAKERTNQRISRAVQGNPAAEAILGVPEATKVSTLEAQDEIAEEKANAPFIGGTVGGLVDAEPDGSWKRLTEGADPIKFTPAVKRHHMERQLREFQNRLDSRTLGGNTPLTKSQEDDLRDSIAEFNRVLDELKGQ